MTKSNKKTKNQKDSTLENVLIAQTSGDTIQLYGEAARQYVIAYSGYDAGIRLQKGLKQLSDFKLNPQWYDQNMKQQAGFAAEIVYTADKNAKEVLNGSQTRYVRTDDIGSVNDPLYDIVKIDANKKVIEGSGEQMKFIGKNGKDWVDKIVSEKKYQKYFDNNVKMSMPSDEYQDALHEINDKIQSLNTKIDNAKNAGYNDEHAIKLREKYIYLKENTIDSGITSQEALFARTHPKIYAAKKITETSFSAGLQQAKYGAIIGAGISIGKNIKACWNKEETVKELLINVGKDSAKAAGSSFVITSTGTAVTAGLKNSSSEILRELSGTALPAMAAVVAFEVGKSMWKLYKGQVTPQKCFEEIRDKSVQIAGSTIGAYIGQIAIPIPVIGALIGSIVGSAISSCVLHECLTINTQVENAHTHRVEVEAQCAEAIRQIRENRMQMQLIAAQYLSGYMQVFNLAFDNMKDAIMSDNIDFFIKSTNMIVQKTGHEIPFSSFEEFNQIMLSDKPLKL